MNSKTRNFSNFGGAVRATSDCIRPDNEKELRQICSTNYHKGLLARGNGLSYSDSCIHNEGTLVDTTRLNHILSFDAKTGIAVCQGGVLLKDLFLLDPQFIPPVIPGTLYATLAGGVAHDVHGKNNPHEGCFGHHIEWLDIQLGEQSLRLSNTENTALFKATIAGLGLTGIITSVAIRLIKAPHFVSKSTLKFTHIPSLFQHMLQEGLTHDYQVAWLDLLNKPRALLTLANHIQPKTPMPSLNFREPPLSVPRLPIRLITHYGMKQFNRAFYQFANTTPQIQPLWQFNNPLDTIENWTRLYGKKGLVQFQATFNVIDATNTFNQLLALIQKYRASPTLAVLKLFTQAGTGILSFVEPGFTIAIDFIHNPEARLAITAMNQLIATQQGKVYLAKDLFLNKTQFRSMYPHHSEFCDILVSYKSTIRSDLSKRLFTI